MGLPPGWTRQDFIKRAGECILKHGWSYLSDAETWVMDHDDDFRDEVLRYVKQHRQEKGEEER